MNVKSALTSGFALLLAAATCALVLSAVEGQAQSGAPGSSAAPAPSKIGVLNVRQAIVSTAEGKQSSAELQSQFAPRQSEMENLRKQIEDVQNKLRVGTGTDEERARLARMNDVLSRQFQRKQDELREDIQAAENEVVDRLGRKLMEVLDRYARENGYSIVFDVSAQTTPVIYASNQVDLTQDLIRLYDQANPIKSSATPSPAQPRPQPGQTRPTQPPPKPPQQ